MSFENKPRLYIDNNLLFRSHRIYLNNEDALVSTKDVHWQLAELYEVELDTNITIYEDMYSGYPTGLTKVEPKGNYTFNQADKFYVVNTYDYHSINGLQDVYLDYEQFRHQFWPGERNQPDSYFAEIVLLNELEYLDYLYGQD